MKNVTFLVLLFVVLLSGAIYLHSLPKSVDIIEERNISCGSILKNDYVGFDV